MRGPEAEKVMLKGKAPGLGALKKNRWEKATSLRIESNSTRARKRTLSEMEVELGWGMHCS